MNILNDKLLKFHKRKHGRGKKEKTQETECLLKAAGDNAIRTNDKVSQYTWDPCDG